MRVGIAIFVCAFVAATARAFAQDCAGPAIPNAPNPLYDRSWIPGGVTFFGADERGVFRMRLGSNATEPIGSHAGHPIDLLSVSPRKRWVQYDSASKGEHWIYATANGRERRIDAPAMDIANRVFSPDETSLAWLEASGGQHRLSVLDLGNFETRTFRLPDAPDPKAVFFDLNWPAKGDRITYAWRYSERQEFYGVDPATGVGSPIPAPREFGADEFAEGAYLLGNGAGPNGLAALQPVHAAKNSIALEGRANIRNEGGTIIVSVPHESPRTIAEAAPGCGAGPLLLDAFDGRYVLYRMTGAYWIYGLRENRKAILYRGAGLLEW